MMCNSWIWVVDKKSILRTSWDILKHHNLFIIKGSVFWVYNGVYSKSWDPAKKSSDDRPVPAVPTNRAGIFHVSSEITMACCGREIRQATHATINNSEWIKTTVTTFKYYGLWNVAVCAHCFTWSEPSNIRTGILDYLREGFPWPARPFKHTESNHLNIRNPIHFNIRYKVGPPKL